MKSERAVIVVRFPQGKHLSILRYWHGTPDEMRLLFRRAVLSYRKHPDRCPGLLVSAILGANGRRGSGSLEAFPDMDALNERHSWRYLLHPDKQETRITVLEVKDNPDKKTKNETTLFLGTLEQFCGVRFRGEYAPLPDLDVDDPDSYTARGTLRKYRRSTSLEEKRALRAKRKSRYEPVPTPEEVRKNARAWDLRNRGLKVVEEEGEEE